MGHEQSKRDRARERRRKQRDIASEESKAKAKNLIDTHMTLRGSLSETLQNTALPSSPLYLVPSTYHLHATHGYNGYQLAYFRIFFCARHTLRMRIPSKLVTILTGEDKSLLLQLHTVSTPTTGQANMQSAVNMLSRYLI